MVIHSSVRGGERHEGSRFEVEHVWRDTMGDSRSNLWRELMITFPVGHGKAFAEVECQMVGSFIPVGHPAVTKSTTGRNFRSNTLPIVD